MTITVSAFIATSLDGFIATSDGGIEWLEQANRAVPPGEDLGYKAFMDGVDTVLVGRKTFEQVRTFDDWPFEGKRVVVLSKRGVEGSAPLPPDVTVTSEAPSALLDRLLAEGVSQVYIDGGQTIQSFLRAGLVHQITVTMIPVLLGSGRSLFGELESLVPLAHISTTSFSFGFVQSKYRVIPPRRP